MLFDADIDWQLYEQSLSLDITEPIVEVENVNTMEW